MRRELFQQPLDLLLGGGGKYGLEMGIQPAVGLVGRAPTAACLAAQQ